MQACADIAAADGKAPERIAVALVLLDGGIAHPGLQAGGVYGLVIHIALEYFGHIGPAFGRRYPLVLEMHHIQPVGKVGDEFHRRGAAVCTQYRSAKNPNERSVFSRIKSMAARRRPAA